LNTSDKQRHPRRMLSSGFTLAVIIGGTIGLGILRTPGEVAAVVPDPLKFVSLWALGGLFILLSAVVAAELVGMTPRSGGTYALVRRTYGQSQNRRVPPRSKTTTALPYPPVDGQVSSTTICCLSRSLEVLLFLDPGRRPLPCPCGHPDLRMRFTLS